MERIRRILEPAAALLAVGFIWQAAVVGFHLPSYLLPPPTAVIAAAVENFGFIIKQLLITLASIGLGFTGGALLGVATAVLIVYSPSVGRLIYPLVILTQSIPKITIAPILLVWFGLGIGSKLALIIMMSYFPVVVNTVTGLTAVEPDALDLLRSLQTSRMKVFWLLRLPNALLSIFDGLKMAITMSIIGAVLAEFIGSDNGIGWLILVAKTNMDLSLSFAAIAFVSLGGDLAVCASSPAPSVFLSIGSACNDSKPTRSGGKPALLQLDGICQTFATREGIAIEALKDINLDIGEGEFLAVVGPSGSGKSTLMRIVAGLLNPSAGEVRLRGQRDPRAEPRIRHRVPEPGAVSLAHGAEQRIDAGARARPRFEEVGGTGAPAAQHDRP